MSLSMLACQQNAKQQTKQQTELGKYSATDARGKVITLNKEAERVVVLFRPIVDEIFMLQANKKIIGVPEQAYEIASGYEYFAKVDPRFANKEIPTPTFGGRANNIESIIGLAPDLVIISDQEKESIQQLEDLNIPVFAASSLNKESIYAELLGIGKLLGREERANKIIKTVDDNLKNLETPEGQKPKRVYYAWSNGRILSTSGKGSQIDVVINMAGAENVCDLGMENPNIGAELLYSWNPDLIILWNSVPDDVYKLKELSALPAVKNKAVRILSPSFNYDPHTVKFILFAKQVHQWCYGNGSESEIQAENEAILNELYN